MMHKVGVIGDRDSVLAFKALGVEVATPIGTQEARRCLDQMAKDDFGVIFITEQIAKEIQESINRYNKSITPAVILIPSNQGSLKIGLDRININVEKAIGSNIL